MSAEQKLPKRPHIGTRIIGGRYWWIGWVLPFVVPVVLVVLAWSSS